MPIGVIYFFNDKKVRELDVLLFKSPKFSAMMGPNLCGLKRPEHGLLKRVQRYIPKLLQNA
ncbi:hypothetical protein PALB_13180 [Pseudoalteromonas luteoviolacea B = ATCC 29581]|nr:hypothetical protein PALB_13180 [Pseudoalteromonas luteoviolacea B = ATCC 29581]